MKPVILDSVFEGKWDVFLDSAALKRLPFYYFLMQHEYSPSLGRLTCLSNLLYRNRGCFLKVALLCWPMVQDGCGGSQPDAHPASNQWKMSWLPRRTLESHSIVQRIQCGLALTHLCLGYISPIISLILQFFIMWREMRGRWFNDNIS